MYKTIEEKCNIITYHMYVEVNKYYVNLVPVSGTYIIL